MTDNILLKLGNNIIRVVSKYCNSTSKIALFTLFLRQTEEWEWDMSKMANYFKKTFFFEK